MERQKTDMPQPSPKLMWNDVLIALQLLTRLPVPDADWSRTDRPPATAAWAYPLAGAIASLPAIIVALLCQWLPLAAPISAGLILAALIMATGALHEDGLADCADGFWGGHARERRLEIMKDSAIGTYGVLSLILVVGLKWAALTHLLEQESAPYFLLAAAMLSRAALSLVMACLPHARDRGLAHATGKPGMATVAVALASAVLVSALVLSTDSLLAAMFAAAAAALASAAVARQKIGGQTGDVLGAVQQLSELAVWIAIAALASAL